MKKLLVILAEWLIEYFKESNGLLAKRIDEELIREADHSKKWYNLQADINLMNMELTGLNTKLITYTQSIEETKDKIEIAEETLKEELRALNEVLDSKEDSEVVRGEL